MTVMWTILANVWLAPRDFISIKPTKTAYLVLQAVLNATRQACVFSVLTVPFLMNLLVSDAPMGAFSAILMEFALNVEGE